MTKRLGEIGEELYEFRRSLMLDRNFGLTKLYNLVHDPSEMDGDINRLREIHAEVDKAVAEAYGWTDLDLGHGFHETWRGQRFTIDPVVRVEVLDRLLELNQTRYEEEVVKGLHSKKTKKSKPTPDHVASIDGGLFPPENTLF